MAVGLALLLPVDKHPARADRPVRISNGEIAEECGFAPAVAQMTECTGTLVHPRVVVYARHCGADQTVEFTHQAGLGRKASIDYCRVHPDDSTLETDWAYCVLNEPIDDIPIIPAGFGCEIEAHVQLEQKVTLCGFGAIDEQDTQDGRKRFGESVIVAIYGARSIDTGPYNGVSACPGDSGGPLLVQLPDGSWRTFGIASHGNGVCGEGGANGYAKMAGAVTWIEEDSGIDITPCFDREGHWLPTASCGGFWAGDATPSGDWENGCAGVAVSGYSDTCGAPWSEPDTDTGADGDADGDGDTDSESNGDTNEPEPAANCECRTSEQGRSSWHWLRSLL